MATPAEQLDPHHLTTGERIHLLRKRNGLALRDLAEKVGVSHAAISGWERGRSHPDSEALFALARALGTSADYLVGLRHSAQPSLGGRKPRHRMASPTRPIQGSLLIRAASPVR